MAVRTSRARRAVGIAGIATSCIVGLVITPTAAHADPAADKAAVQDQIIKAQHEVEVVAEQYNDAKIELAELNEAKAAAEAAAGLAEASLIDEKQNVAETGASLYKSPVPDDAATIMSAATPQEIIDKLNMLAQISDHYGQTVAELKAGQSAAASAAAAAEQAAADAAKTEQSLAAKKAEIEAKLPDLEAQLAALTEAERAAVLAQAGGHATQPASDEASEPSNESSSPSSSASAAPGSSSPSSQQSTPPPAQSTPAAVTAGSGGSSTAQAAVDAALTRLGMPYKWAAAGPSSFDCSGLTMWAYAQAGVSLPHSSSAQASGGTTVPISAAAPGDILWLPGHVGMYIGNGQVVHAPTTGDVVKVISVGSMSWQKAVRVA